MVGSGASDGEWLCGSSAAAVQPAGAAAWLGPWPLAHPPALSAFGLGCFARALGKPHLIPCPHLCIYCMFFFPSSQQGRQCVFLTFEGMIYKQPLMCLLTSFFHCLNFKFFGRKLLKSVQYALKGFARIWVELLPNGNTYNTKKKHVSDFNWLSTVHVLLNNWSVSNSYRCLDLAAIWV